MITNTVPNLSPEVVQTQFTVWWAVLLFIGGAVWHIVLKIAPWAKAQGGLLRGVRDFFWSVPPAAPKP